MVEDLLLIKMLPFLLFSTPAHFLSIIVKQQAWCYSNLFSSDWTRAA